MANHKNQTFLGFAFFLLSRWRTALAVISFSLWLLVTLVFSLTPPSVDTSQNKPEFFSLAFWTDGWWRYSGTLSLKQVGSIADAQPWIFSYRGLLVTDNSGKNWTLQKIEANASLYSIYFMDKQHGWVVGDNGTILSTTDGGVNWSAQDSKTKASLYSVYFVDKQNGWAVGGGAILSTVDGGRVWSAQDSKTKEELQSVYFVDKQNGWAVGYRTILSTTDGGVNWSVQGSKAENWLYSVYFVDKQNGWAVGYNGTILFTTNGGVNWSVQDSKTKVDLKSVHFVDKQTGWTVGGNGTILVTTDGGVNWSVQDGKTTESLESVYFVVNPNGWGWVVGNNGTFLSTTDGGVNWNKQQMLSANLPEWYFVYTFLSLIIFLFGLYGIHPPESSDSISTMLSSDKPQQGHNPDALGTKPLAWAISRFLRHSRTEPPLTLALNAPWGGGKSSLMNWLREDLQRFGFRPVWFNAWHYEKQEQMFSALLETVRQQAIPPLFSMTGIKFRSRLLKKRAADNQLATTILLLLTVFLAGFIYQQKPSISEQTHCVIEQYFHVDNQQTAFCSSTVAKTADNSQVIDAKEKKGKDDEPEAFWQTFLRFFPWLAPFYGLWKGMQSFSQPKELFSQFFNGDEQSQARKDTNFREQFAQDFSAVTEALDRTLIVFIDDLDRCLPKSVCEVMETVNFLASEGRCHIVFGIWREGVERAIGLGFTDIAKEFAKIDALRSGEENLDEAEIRRRYGQKYLEKLINIWVTVPIMNAQSTEKLLIPDAAIGESQISPEPWLTHLKKLAIGFIRHEVWRPRYWFSRLTLVWQNVQQGLVNIKHTVFQRETWRFNNLITLFGRALRKLVLWGVRGGLIVLFGGGLVVCLFYLWLFLLIGIDRNNIGWIFVILSGLLVSLLGLTYCLARQSFQKLIAWLLPKNPPSPKVLYYVAVFIFLIYSVAWSFKLGENFKGIQYEASTQTVVNTPPISQSANPQSETTTNTKPTTTTIPEPVQTQAETAVANITSVSLTQSEFFQPVLGSVIIVLLVFAEFIRYKIEQPSDSPAFHEALQFWSPVLAKRFDTPRRLKRFLNHLRFNAMRIRTLDRADLTIYESFWEKLIRVQHNETREQRLAGEESKLLLMSVLESCCGGQFEAKAMLVDSDGSIKGFKTGWEQTIKIDQQLVAEHGRTWADQLLATLIERLRYFEKNQMPQPTHSDLLRFEALMPARITPESVRPAGLTETDLAWNSSSFPDRRKRGERRQVTLEGFVNERRSGIARRQVH
jgi:photosystem II stability/assembly factor-like uncharacterized protein